MLSLFGLSFLSLLIGSVFSSPLPSSTPLPVILWHGLGDKSDSDGLISITDLIRSVHPGTHTYIISLGEDGSTDQRSSFFGNVTAQNDEVCALLSSNPILSRSAGRIDALGFSQGGLFLRGLAERCDGIKVRSLVTFGSPHNGIVDLPRCGTWDVLCKAVEGAFRGNKWSEWAQSNIVPAQYFRELDEKTGLGSEEYLNYSSWLPDVNNERHRKNEAYKKRIAGLDHFVMYMFEEDKTVLPKETAWFADVNVTSGRVTNLTDRLLYKQDWLGLRQLDEKGGLIMRLIEKAGHMRFTDKLLKETVREFFGPERSTTRPSIWSTLTNWSFMQDVSLVGDW